jgi:phosphoribosyl 1,2-cyclic phosphodiesterase
LLSNLRLYHILGFQFTPLVYVPHTRTYIIAPDSPTAPLQVVFDQIMNIPYSPIFGLANLLAEVHFEAAREDLGTVQGMRLIGKSLGESWSYRLETPTSSLAYLVDAALSLPDGSPHPTALGLARDADILIAGIPQPDYGEVLGLAATAGVRQVLITHHSPHLTDDDLDDRQADLDELALPFAATLAAEGMVWEV